MIRRYSQWLLLLVAAAALIVILVYNRQQLQAQVVRPMPAQTAPAPSPDVRVITVSPASHQATVSGYGTARPRFQLTLTARVSGQIEQLGKTFEDGNRIERGTLLVQLEDSAYRAAVSSAEHELATARLDLLEEQRAAIQARTEWEASGLEGAPDSELVLHQPQLDAAKAAVTDASSTLSSASKNFAQTKITAPFDALVVERQVAPGSYLQAGTAVATLYSTDRIEVAVSLSARDWQNLPDLATLTAANWPVTLTSVESGQRWNGRVLRAAQHLDETTRQRALIVALDNPLEHSPALLPGTFLKVDIAGKQRDALWQLPSSALSQRGEIWYVTQENTLACFEAEPLFSDAGAIYVQVPKQLAATTRQVLVHPLSSYLQGMKVNPLPGAQAIAASDEKEPSDA